jgi:hypothetical protein
MTAYNIESKSSHNILCTRKASLILITIIILREGHKKGHNCDGLGFKQ